MYRPRIIPVLLLNGVGLIKTVKFDKPTYIGDPINAVRIFNDFEADELVFLDIYATKQNRLINTELIRKIADEAYMPFSVGGGIKSFENAKSIFDAGTEKVILNNASFSNPQLITKIAEHYGNQSIIVSIDIKKNILGKYYIASENGSKKQNIDLMEYIDLVIEKGAGEIFLNFIDLDGTYQGYNIELIEKVNIKSSIPVIACGGASSIRDMVELYKNSQISGIAAGSIFVYHGKLKGILINYPTRAELRNYFSENYE
jgi:cyclase